MLRQRIVSAFIVLPVVLWAVYTGGLAFLLLMAGLAFFAWRELMQLQGEFEPWLLPLGGLLLLAVLCGGYFSTDILLLVFTSGIFLLLLAFLWHYGRLPWETFTYACTSFCYLGLPLSYLLRLANLPEGRSGVFLVFFCVWSYDSAAFFVGSRFGRRKPWPHISPNKSVEGVIGGLLGSILVAALAFYFLLPNYSHPRHFLLALLYGVGVGAFAQAGDLFESALKRTFSAKDSGIFLPGHGGVLDRIDSIIFAVPFAYYFLSSFVL